MAATLKGTVVSLLLLSSISQGVHGVDVFHRESVRAVEGQNITLPCLLEVKEGRKPVISQVEWRKKGELEDHKLVVFNPSFGETLIWPNVALDVAWDKDKLMGTSLVLKDVEARDSGRYICDITTYPNGSIRKVTRLRVEGPAVTVTPGNNVTEPTVTDNNVTEPTVTGNNVTEPTVTGNNVTEPTVTDNNVTEPTVTGNNVTEPTVTCNNVTEPTVTDNNVTEPMVTGNNVTEPTATGTNVTSDLPGPGEMTTPTANFSVTPDTLTSSTVQEVNTSITMTTSVTQLINSNTHRSVNTEAGPKGSEVNSSTDSPVRVPSTAQSGSTYPPKVQSDQPTPWSVRSDGGQRNKSEAETSSFGGQGGPVFTTLTPEKSTLAEEKEDHTLGTSTTSTSTPSHGETGPSSGQRYVVVWVLLPVLALLLVVGYLYRRYIIQKRMDLPPPFKPPPPPVKYSSLRAHDVPMTDILT
ncbi:mucin-5AC isoform X1 [Oncorhynchus tshawytscha]|uniref:Ig-like domain-containing protein n=1 Tax=Oncorhynchus tshawytscha TaxID=74940 RepID=A0AAZ3QNT7_ONCTS|nr:mucin-5AC isoform X1 [Oncorhynchus tshawytscha]